MAAAAPPARVRDLDHALDLVAHVPRALIEPLTNLSLDDKAGAITVALHILTYVVVAREDAGILTSARPALVYHVRWTPSRPR